MRAGLILVGIAVWTAACLGQTAPPPSDYTLYYDLFQRVVNEAKPSFASGATVQDSARLTDSEMKSLRSIAADCWSAIDAAGEAQRARIVLLHVEQLKTAFGDARFKTFDAWLRADYASRPRRKEPR
jgi:hypothetical protein